MGLWLVIDSLNGDAYTDTDLLPAWIQEKALDELKDLLSRGLVYIGQFDRIGDEYIFEIFPGNPEEIIQKVKNDWNALERNPSLGDVCWIRSTEKGKELARLLGL
jgi:hypothetical protein